MEKECCPPFDPEAWNGKTVTWNNKRFAKERVFCLFYVPVTFGRAIKRLQKRMDEVKASCPDWLCLADHTSKWNMDIYLAVDRDLPGVEMHSKSGEYISKVYEGPFKDTGQWCKSFNEFVAREGKKIRKMFMWYTTCPKCAKKRGKNYVAIIAETAA